MEGKHDKTRETREGKGKKRKKKEVRSTVATSFKADRTLREGSSMEQDQWPSSIFPKNCDMGSYSMERESCFLNRIITVFQKL